MNKDAQLNGLASQVGYEEQGDNENDFTKWQSDNAWSAAAWCDSFAQWGAVGNGGFAWPDYCQWGFKGDAYVPYTRKHAMDLGMWRDKGWTPDSGWQVLYDWNGDGVADHIGTVWDARSYPNGSLVSLEGNTGNGVVKYCLRDSTFIMGFVALPFDGVDYQPPSQPEIVNPSPDGAVGQVVWPALSVATRSSQPLYTSVLQKAIVVDVDGDYYTATRNGVVGFQRRYGLQIDGAVGVYTSTAVVQSCLNFIGYDCGTIDGECGEQTTEGIKGFQTACNITVDGIFAEESTQTLANLAGI